MAPELAYDLLARNDEEARRILDNVDLHRGAVLQSRRPDHGHRVVQQDSSARSSRGRIRRGCIRSTRATTTTATRSDEHPRLAVHGEACCSASGSRRPTSITTTWARNGARIFLPPYAEPVRPSADPLVWRELSWYGAHMAYKEEEAELSGVINDADLLRLGPLRLPLDHAVPQHRGHADGVGERAARVAGVRAPRPARGNTRNLPEYEEQTNFPESVAGRHGGACATSSSGRRSRRGRRSISRRAIARRCCGTRI